MTKKHLNLISILIRVWLHRTPFLFIIFSAFLEPFPKDMWDIQCLVMKCHMWNDLLSKLCMGFGSSIGLKFCNQVNSTHSDKFYSCSQIYHLKSPHPPQRKSYLATARTILFFSSFRTLHTSTSAITRIGLRNVATDKENSVANPSHLWNQERFHFVTRAHMCYCMYFHPYVYSLNL